MNLKTVENIGPTLSGRLPVGGYRVLPCLGTGFLQKTVH